MNKNTKTIPPSISQVINEFKDWLHSQDCTNLNYLAPYQEVLSRNMEYKHTIIDALVCIVKDNKWKISERDIRRSLNIHRAFDGISFSDHASAAKAKAKAAGNVSDGFIADEETMSLMVERNDHLHIICDCIPQVEALSDNHDTGAVAHISLMRKCEGEKIGTDVCTIPLRDVTTSPDKLYAALSNKSVITSSEVSLLTEICNFIKFQAMKVKKKRIPVFDIPGIDSDNGILVADNAVIMNGKVLHADARGHLRNSESEPSAGFMPSFKGSGIFITPTIPRGNDCLLSPQEKERFVNERQRLRGGSVSLLDANFLVRFFVSPEFCRASFGHSIPYPYVTGASGSGKQDAMREALFLHFGLPFDSDGAVSAGKTMAFALERLARNRMPLLFGESNKGGEKSFSLSANPEFYQFVLSSYDGCNNSNMRTQRPMRGFPIFNGATIPTDSDELAKRIDEIDIIRIQEDAPESLADLKEITIVMRHEMVALQREILTDHRESRARFIAEYKKLRSEISTWSNTYGRDGRHLGHAALSLTASRLVNHRFPIASQVEAALRRRFNKSENVSRFQRTAALLEHAYQTLSTRSIDRCGAIFLLSLTGGSAPQRYLCIALGTLISQIRGSLGDRWKNPIKEAHVYENLGVGKIDRENKWVTRISRDKNRRENMPLRNKEIILLSIDHPEFPSELQTAAENIAGLCKDAGADSTKRSDLTLPWGTFEHLVEGEHDVG